MASSCKSVKACFEQPFQRTPNFTVTQIDTPSDVVGLIHQRTMKSQVVECKDITGFHRQSHDLSPGLKVFCRDMMTFVIAVHRSQTPAMTTGQYLHTAVGSSTSTSGIQRERI